MRPFICLILFVYVTSACAPYANGPVFTPENARTTFQPIVEFMEIKSGMTVADVGAGSGALTVIMATQLTNCQVYIQDIDRNLLDSANVNKMVRYYQEKMPQEPGLKNTFHIIHGTPVQTGLPEGAVDRIYSNATMHVLEYPDEMLQDLRKKLKPDGLLFIRDGFRNDNGEGEYCSSKDCGKPLLDIEEFLALMKRNGYAIVKQSPDLKGYPVFGFRLEN